MKTQIDLWLLPARVRRVARWVIAKRYEISF